MSGGNRQTLFRQTVRDIGNLDLNPNDQIIWTRISDTHDIRDLM
jgi:hypothetical protein